MVLKGDDELNLQKLFKTQAELDERIVKEKGLEEQDLLDKKVLALQVELGELANEWRGFKFWSEKQISRIILCAVCEGGGYIMKSSTTTFYCKTCKGTGKSDNNPLLEEYVDCLHFILSIGNDMRFIRDKIVRVIIDSDYTRETITETFNEMFFAITELNKEFKNSSVFTQAETYVALFNLFV